MLKFPIRDTNISETRKKRINQGLSIVLIIIILPSIYLGYRMSENEKFRVNAEKYTRYVGIYKGNYLLNNEIVANRKEINLVYGGSSLTEEDKNAILGQASLFSLEDAKITIEQGLAIDNDIAKDRQKAQSEEERSRQQIARLNVEIAGYKQKIDSIQNQYLIGKQLLSELTPLYPQIESCLYSETYIYAQNDTLHREKTGIFMIASKQILSKSEQQKIENWLTKRLNKEGVKVYFDRSN